MGTNQTTLSRVKRCANEFISTLSVRSDNWLRRRPIHYKNRELSPRFIQFLAIRLFVGSVSGKMNLTTVLVIFVAVVTQLVVGIRYDRTPAMCDRNRAPNNTFYRLPKTVTPLKYRLKFRTDVNPYKFHAAEQIQVLINNRTDIIELNSVDLRIESVWFKTRRLRGMLTRNQYHLIS